MVGGCTTPRVQSVCYGSFRGVRFCGRAGAISIVLKLTSISVSCRARARAVWVGLVVFVERIQSANVISRARRESPSAPVGREIDGTHERRVRARARSIPATWAAARTPQHRKIIEALATAVGRCSALGFVHTHTHTHVLGSIF